MWQGPGREFRRDESKGIAEFRGDSSVLEMQDFGITSRGKVEPAWVFETKLYVL